MQISQSFAFVSHIKGLAVTLALFLCAGPGGAAVVCTLIVDAKTETILIEDGDCDIARTPASTFKVPLALIGFETGILESADVPVLEYRPGEPDWGGENWTRPTTPRDWMRHSVVWYSQRLTRALGAETLTDYAVQLRLGNADFSGDVGEDNGLDRAWLSSSLKITPREQMVFLCGLARGTLPLSKEAMKQTRRILPQTMAASWRMTGKTGSAYPREADGSFDYTRGIGWYVGWAEDADHQLVFVRLTQAEERLEGSPGTLTRDAFLSDWPDLATSLGF